MSPMHNLLFALSEVSLTIEIEIGKSGFKATNMDSTAILKIH